MSEADRLLGATESANNSAFPGTSATKLRVGTEDESFNFDTESTKARRVE